MSGDNASPLAFSTRCKEVETYEAQVPALQAGPLVHQPVEKLRSEQTHALRAELI